MTCNNAIMLLILSIFFAHSMEETKKNREQHKKENKQQQINQETVAAMIEMHSVEKRDYSSDNTYLSDTEDSSDISEKNKARNKRYPGVKWCVIS